MASNVGGRVDITFNGRTVSPVADVEIDEANFEVDAVDNQDGTVGRSVKSKHYELDIKIRHAKGLKIEELMGIMFDFSMIERDTGQTILMTGAFLTGTPKRNTTTGEISGLKICSDNMQRVAR